ncbi:MAG: UMP kinase [Clostridia bacterium]|nr:UMP kinase [Clostridia bacterium]MBP3706195.1 UMP kinase [Clostridia bacterium]
MEPVYKRILLKLSGEVLSGEKGTGIDFNKVEEVCKVVKECVDLGVEIAIVVGGGNFWRGRSSGKMDRTRADHMGMLATTINSLALGDCLEQLGVTARVQTAIEMRQIAEPYIRNKAIRHLEKGRVVIFGCGTGNPFFSTDTAAALRAAEICADVIFKATNVDGVYDSDPKLNPSAKKFDTLSHYDVLQKGLHVMDSTAASLCMDNGIKILVFNLNDPSNIKKAVLGENNGTLVE